MNIKYTPHQKYLKDACDELQAQIDNFPPIEDALDAQEYEELVEQFDEFNTELVDSFM